MSATAQLASNGYRIAKSWQYQESFPNAPTQQQQAKQPAQVGRAGAAFRCLQLQTQDSLSKRPLLGGGAASPSSSEAAAKNDGSPSKAAAKSG